MSKYGIEMILETTSQYKTVKLSVMDCETKEEAEAELTRWLLKKKTLIENEVNSKVIEMVME